MKIIPVSEAVYRERCRRLLSAPNSKCEYDEWKRTRKDLIEVCKEHGKLFRLTENDGDFNVLEDWHTRRELCLKEVRSGFLTVPVLTAVGKFITKLQLGYFVLIGPEDVMEPVRYSVLLSQHEACVTTLGAPNARTVLASLAGFGWFAGVRSGEIGEI